MWRVRNWLFCKHLVFNFASQGNNLLGRSLQSNTLVYLSSEDNWSEEKHSEKYLIINKSISGKLLLNIPVLTQLIYSPILLIYLLFSQLYCNTGFETSCWSESVWYLLNWAANDPSVFTITENAPTGVTGSTSVKHSVLIVC